MIAATNQDLEKLTIQDRFRQDLFFSVKYLYDTYSPLRRRAEDVFKMTEYFLDKYNKEYQVLRRISPETMFKLQAYKFSGNVRELQNIIKNAVVLSESDLQIS